MSLFKKIHKVLTYDWKSVNVKLNHMCERSGRSKFSILYDIRQEEKNGYHWSEYYLYKFDLRTDPEIRNSYVGILKDYKKIFGEYRDIPEYKQLSDKRCLISVYGDLVGRDMLNLEISKYNDFENFVSKHDVIYAKIPVSYGGRGVEKVLTGSQDCKTLYNRLLAEGKVLIEEEIDQHEDMSILTESSVSTIRVGTAVNEAGDVSILYTTLRINIHGDFCNNDEAWTLLSEDGEIIKPIFTNNPIAHTIEINPLNGKSYIGFKIPMFEQVKELAIKAASIEKKLKYVGWDIAVSKNGPVLIEANDYPGTSLFQTYEIAGETGRVRDFEEKLNIRLR